MSAHTAVYTLSVGRLSPFPPVISEGVAASLVVDAAAPILVINMSKPSASDIDLIATGAIGVALDRERESALILWGFHSIGVAPLVVETPLHVGVEDVRHFPNLSLKGLAPDEGRGAVVMMQDERGIVQMIRPIVVPRAILKGLAPLISKQLAVRRDGLIMQRHWDNIRRYYARKPDLALAFDLAPIKGRAS